MNTKKVKYKKEGKKEKEAMSTALGIPRRSPIQVLTETRRYLTSGIGREPVFSTWYGRRR